MKMKHMIRQVPSVIENLPVPNLRANENEAHDETSPECH